MEITGLTPTQAAQILGLSPERVRQLGDAGKLKFRKTPFGRLFDQASVERLRDERAEEASA